MQGRGESGEEVSLRHNGLELTAEENLFTYEVY